jgi:small subunit ribosomal protein S6e
MAVWKLVINEPETKKSYQLEVDKSKAVGIVGKKIGDEFNGDLVGLPGYTLKITGGTDKDGFPMHPSVTGAVRRRILLTNPPGFHPKLKGQRKRKTVCGNTVSEDIAQINCKVVKKGEKALEELIPTKPKEKKEVKPEVEKPKVKEEKPKEVKPKEKKEVKPEAGKPVESIKEKPKAPTKESLEAKEKTV